jgi:YD repeat-containing protein
MAPVTQPPTIGSDSHYPNFTIDKVREADSSPVSGPLSEFHQDLQTHGLFGVHMPNGWYVMKFHINNYNQNLPVIIPGEGSPTERNASFSIAYDMLDTSGAVINYFLAGLRVKSITTTDPYANITSQRNFRYHNPVNDSSYGVFIGSSANTFVESSQYGQWQVRMGNFNMPGMGNVASSIIYPKVIEDVTDNGVTYRTEHYYSRGLSIYPSYSGMGWPFYPADDLECGRGNEYMTIWNKQSSSAFAPAKIKQQVFDFDPPTVANPNIHFRRQLFGIKCSMSTYDLQVVGPGGGGYAPSFVAVYPISTTRLYMTSDSTKTYDLNNPYNSVNEWHDYVYGDKGQQPIITRTGNSDGSVTVQKNWYAADQPEPSSEINTTLASQMVTANRISNPLGTKIYKDNQLLSQQFTYPHFTVSRLLTDSMRQAIFSNPLEMEIKVLAYDDAANPLSILLRGNKYRKYIWNKQGSLALATCVMPQDGAFFFTSFEHAEYPAGTTNTAHFSGSYAYQLSSGNISLNGFNSSTGLEVYAWTTGGGFTTNTTPAVNTGITSGAWTLYKASLGAVTAVTISGSAMIDQLAVLPVGSSFEGNVYDGAGRIVSKVTNDMQTTFFEYDNFGRLTIVRDMQGNILKSSSYQYQAAQ